MRAQQHLVIFARYPVAGGGKRRLAAGIGAVHALRFQRVRLQVLIGRFARDPRWTTWIAVTPDRSGPWPKRIRTTPQGDGDLGQRMNRIFENLPLGRAIIIGTDIPGVANSDIAEAFAKLGSHHAVFGPATDGGYWLVGLKRAPRVLSPFQNVRWSTEHALADTEKNLHGRRIGFVRKLDDVDNAAALKHHPEWARMCWPPPAALN